MWSQEQLQHLHSNSSCICQSQELVKEGNVIIVNISSEVTQSCRSLAQVPISCLLHLSWTFNIKANQVQINPQKHPSQKKKKQKERKNTSKAPRLSVIPQAKLALADKRQVEVGGFNNSVSRFLIYIRSNVQPTTNCV